MPELPEVETVARDLRPRILGATITGARVSWARTLRTHTTEAFARPIAGRRVEAVWRRAKQIVIDLSGDAALTIHLKMTGQLFVVPADTPVDPYVRLVLELADGREVRFRDIRKFGKIGLYGRDPVTGELVTEVGGSAVFAELGPERLDPAFSVRDFRRRLRKRSGRLKPLLLDQSFIAGVGNIYADEALWAARLHPLRTAGTLRPPTSGTCTRRSGGSWPRRSCAAEARSTTTPRPTVMARCRSTCRSTSAPANRARAADGRSSASSSGRDRPTSARGASGWAPATARAPRRPSGR